MKTKVGQKVWKITINKIVNAKSDLYKSGVTIEDSNILGISDYKICLDNRYFTTFSHLPEKGTKKRILPDLFR